MSFGTPTVLAQCEHNALNALYKRHLSAPPNPCTRPFHSCFLDYIQTKLVPQFHLVRQVCEGAWKKKKTQSKLDSIDRSVVYDRFEFQRAKSFVKREISVKVPKKARLIQGNFNETTAYHDPDTFKAISHLFEDVRFEAEGVSFALRYTSGCTNADISRLFSDEVAMPTEKLYDERDGTNWDSTMQEPHMRFEASVYSLFDAVIGQRHLQRSTHCKGTIATRDYIIKYVTRWKRLSGDWNTSVGNSIISMAICITAILSLPSHLRPHRVAAFFHGDDYLAIYHYHRSPPPQVLNTALADLEKSLGITPVRGVFRDPLLVEYISMSVWPCYDGTYFFAPKLSNLFVRLFFSTRPLSQHTADDVCATIAALAPHFVGCEPAERFFAAHRRAWVARRRGIKHAGNQFRDCHSLEKLEIDHTPKVHWAYGFAHKYHMPITALHVEVECGSAALLRHPAYDHLFECEHLDPDVRMGASATRDI